MILRVILALLIIIPAIEIGIFIWIGQYIGFSWTFLIIMLTAVIGVWLTKQQGMQAIRLAQVQIQNRDIPSDAILDGICVFIGGVLLITPGLLTDLVGFLFLIPFTRSLFKAWLKLWFANLIRKRTASIFMRRR